MLQKGGPGWMYPIPKDAELGPEDHPTASWRARKYLTRNRVFRRVCIILDLVAQASIAGAWALWIYDQTAGAGLADPNLLGLLFLTLGPRSMAYAMAALSVSVNLTRTYKPTPEGYWMKIFKRWIYGIPVLLLAYGLLYLLFPEEPSWVLGFFYLIVFWLLSGIAHYLRKNWTKLSGEPPEEARQGPLLRLRQRLAGEEAFLRFALGADIAGALLAYGFSAFFLVDMVFPIPWMPRHFGLWGLLPVLLRWAAYLLTYCQIWLNIGPRLGPAPPVYWRENIQKRLYLLFAAAVALGILNCLFYGLDERVFGVVLGLLIWCGGLGRYARKHRANLYIGDGADERE